MKSAGKWQVGGVLTAGRAAEILAGISNVRAALIGDICLDAYWKADMTRSELSRETPHYPLPIVEERYSPGAGGNAAANIAALLPKSIAVVGAIGQDWRGDVLLQELTSRGIGVAGLVRDPGWLTNAYIKPCRQGLSDLVYEDPRLDFANQQPQPAALDEAVIARLDRIAPDIDVLCVNDQFQNGCLTAPVREKVIALAKAGLKVIVDSRYRIGLFTGCILKPNDLEALAAVRMNMPQGQRELAIFAAAAGKLARLANAPVCLTAGEYGCLVSQTGRDTPCHVPAPRLSSPLDTCGAGDTFIAAFSCALAAGAALPEAAGIANMAASVTVQKIGQTGTASRSEILARCAEAGQ